MIDMEPAFVVGSRCLLYGLQNGTQEYSVHFNPRYKIQPEPEMRAHRGHYLFCGL